MTTAQLIKMALAYLGKSEAWLAREIGSSPSAFNQRMKTDKFSADDLERIATAMGASYECHFIFEDGTRI